MNAQGFAVFFRHFQERINEAWRRLTGHPSQMPSDRYGRMVVSSRQRSRLAYQEFARTSSRQMQDFLYRNRNWHH